MENNYIMGRIMGIELWADTYKNPNISARREGIENFEDSILNGNITPIENSGSDNNSGNATSNPNF